ncbi:hypothetical protein PV325_012811 [Microctonus aethiopoides]|nr:hypothetical protein PV325_012811 [Microctonus aethiopoides]
MNATNDVPVGLFHPSPKTIIIKPENSSTLVYSIERCATDLKHPFAISAIFTHDQKNSSTELAFKYAVYKINKEKVILPKTNLVYDIQYVPKDDSFHASKKA